MKAPNGLHRNSHSGILLAEPETFRAQPSTRAPSRGTMPKPRTDWHPEDIKAAVRKTGTTLSALARAGGLSDEAGRRCLQIPWPRVEALIAQRIGRKPQDIWPSRYEPDGQPKKGLHAGKALRSATAPTPHRQKSEAA